MEMMRKGELPVPYIIALILGIVVVGILGYGFFILGWRIPGLSNQGNCQTKVTEWCSQWSKNDYDSNNMPADTWETYAPGCDSAGIGQPSAISCRLAMGLKSTGQSCTDKVQCASQNCKGITKDNPVGTCS
jgi:hypothetical protein